MLRPLTMPLAYMFTSPQTTELVMYPAGVLLYFWALAYDVTGHMDQKNWSCFTRASYTGNTGSIPQNVPKRGTRLVTSRRTMVTCVTQDILGSFDFCSCPTGGSGELGHEADL